MQGVENSQLVYVPARETTLFHWVRARRTVALKNPQLLDNTTSNYTFNLPEGLKSNSGCAASIALPAVRQSGPNLVTPAARLSGRGRWMVSDATLPWSSRGEQRVRHLTLSCSEGHPIFS